MTIDQAAAAQDARSVLYGIKVLQDKGNLVKPPAFANLTDEQFGDPVNYRFPFATPELFKASMRIYSPWDSEYSEDERIVIGARLYGAMKLHGLNEKDYYFNRRPAGGQQGSGIYSHSFAAGIMNPTLQAFVDWLKQTYNEDKSTIRAEHPELDPRKKDTFDPDLDQFIGGEITGLVGIKP